MRNFLMGLWKDESGASAAEYALLLALIAVGIGIAAGELGTVIGDAIEDACAEIDSAADCNGA
jgi:pilus assembly protein Flp/PilA